MKCGSCFPGFVVLRAALTRLGTARAMPTKCDRGNGIVTAKPRDCNEAAGAGPYPDQVAKLIETAAIALTPIAT